MRIVDEEEGSDGGQSPVVGIEEGVCGLVVLRTDPLSLEDSPEGLCEVEVRRVWREEEEEESPLLPYGSQFLDQVAAVDRRVVEHDEGVPVPGLEGEPVEEPRDLVGGDAFGGHEPVISVLAVNHAEDVEAGYPLRGDIDVLAGQLPSIRYVSLRADVALVGVVEFDAAFGGLKFKFLQLPGLVVVELRRGLPPWAFPYTLISCANADKKRLNVDSLASLPLACCQASLALFTLCRSCSMAWRTASSSEQPIIGLRPRPGRVSRPFSPSLRYLLSQVLTVCSFIPVLSPTLAEDIPSDFNSTDRQRILKQCCLPLRYPSSSSARRASPNSIRDALIPNVFTIVTRNTA